MDINPVSCLIFLLRLCIEGKKHPHHPTSVVDMTLSHLMVRFKYWNFAECGKALHCSVHSDSVRVSSMGQIIIIIMWCRQHGYPWPSLSTSPYRSSLLAGLQGYIPYPYIVAVCIFELVVLLLLGHMWGSVGVHHLWARPCMSGSSSLDSFRDGRQVAV